MAWPTKASKSSNVPRSGWIGVVAALLRADRPRRAGVVGRGRQGVVRALAERGADRVDRRQVDDVEAHLARWPAAASPRSGRSRTAERGGPRVDVAPSERGKNSYQAPNSARSRLRPAADTSGRRVTRSRSGCRREQRRGSAGPVGRLEPHCRSSSRSRRQRADARQDRRRRSRRCRHVLAARSSSRAPSSSISSTSWPARDLDPRVVQPGGSGSPQRLHPEGPAALGRGGVTCAPYRSVPGASWRMAHGWPVAAVRVAEHDGGARPRRVPRGTRWREIVERSRRRRPWRGGARRRPRGATSSIGIRPIIASASVPTGAGSPAPVAGSGDGHGLAAGDRRVLGEGSRTGRRCQSPARRNGASPCRRPARRTDRASRRSRRPRAPDSCLAERWYAGARARRTSWRRPVRSRWQRAVAVKIPVAMLATCPNALSRAVWRPGAAE